MQEMDIIEIIRARLSKGHKDYGDLDVHDGRDWPKEALEEVIDCMIYAAAELLRMRSKPVEEIRQQTLKTLESVVAACEEARRIEREAGVYHQHMQANLRHIMDLRHATERRIAELDGSGLEQKERDWAQWVSTRRDFVYGPSVGYHDNSEFYKKVAKFDPSSACPRNKGQK